MLAQFHQREEDKGIIKQKLYESIAGFDKFLVNFYAHVE